MSVRPPPKVPINATKATPPDGASSLQSAGLRVRTTVDFPSIVGFDI